MTQITKALAALNRVNSRIGPLDFKDGAPRQARLYSPLESFFTKAWRPSKIELVP